MGVIKRMLKRTSHKLLAKIGAQRASQQLVLSAPGALLQPSPFGQPLAGQQKSSRARRTRKHLKRAAREPISEALMMAAKNCLPPVQFHHVHGPNAQLAKSNMVARRTQGFCHALVFSNRVILPNERVYIKVLEIAKGWNGTIRFGFTSVDPATLRYQMPKHACPDMTNAGHTWARALADEVVRRNSVIHFSYNESGYIHYGINNQDCGIFHANVNTTQHLWFILDIYGLTAAVELIDPRIHNASSESDFDRLDDELRTGHLDRSTLSKSTGAMNELMSIARKDRKKRRKASRRPGLAYDQWAPLDSLFLQPPNGHLQAYNQTHVLPNLNSMMLPQAQQNIYSPMPSVDSRRWAPVQPVNIPEPHYYQIMTNNQSHPLQRMTKMSAAPAAANVSLASAGTSSSSCALNSSTTSTSARSRIVHDDQDLCEQLDNLQVSDYQNQHPQSVSRSTKSTISGSQPVAATRRRQQQNNSAHSSGNSKRTNDPSPSASSSGPRDETKITHKGTSSSSSVLSPLTRTKGSTANGLPSAKAKPRHSTRALKSQTAHDDNNNNPPNKDCPICFERPINCVLYQCGHMCTCYECGVKQWRTQSRTCPICRTIIKDVIKTYMS